MKIALAQMKMNCDMESNYEKTLRLIDKAADAGADLICFPEIQLTPFFPQYSGKDAGSYALAPDDPMIRGIRDKCRESKIFASPNLYIEERSKRYDMSLLISGDGEIIGTQKMVHIAQCKKFYEQEYYTPSEEGFRVFDTQLGKIGIVVCFDRHYPESVRTEALRGAELVIIPTANTTEETCELFQWEVKVQAFQNSVNVAMCNRVGVEEDMAFSGESIVADYNGNTVALAGNSEELLLAEIDLPAAAEARCRKPYTGLRRVELYE